MIKKFIIPLSLLLGGCSMSKESLVKQSDVVVTNKDESIVYIKNNEIGRLIHPTWADGTYGPATVYLVDEKDFNRLTNGRQ